jgi:glycosyltransferase involved in cell wall biosynthesis
MLQQPSVSVIIATYNRARYLAEAIDSVLSQRFRSFELIIVDDGSTDDTQELLRSYGDRLRFYRQENRGPSAARNLGVHHARGEWIAIQDSDDLYRPSHLEVLFRYVEAHPECRMVFANGAYLDRPEHGRDTIIPVGKSRRLARDGVTIEDIFQRSIVRLQAALISKSAYDEVGGHDESLRICMDLDLSFRLFMNFPVHYIDETVFQYRKHDGNTGKDEDLRLMENIRVIEKLLKNYPATRKLLGQQKLARRIAYRYYRLAKGRRKRGHYRDALQAIEKAVCLYPLSVKYWVYKFQWKMTEG